MSMDSNITDSKKTFVYLALSVKPLIQHITDQDIMQIMLLVEIKVYLHSFVVLFSILDYSIHHSMQTTLDANRLLTVATSYLGLTNTDC